MSKTKVHDWGMTTMYEGDVRESLRAMPANSVHCIVTSPPYWALRSYLAKDDPLKSFELGSEPTPDEFVANMVGVFREARRVLRDDGVCFVNLGDTYIGSGKGGNPGTGWKQNTNEGSQSVRGNLNRVEGIPDLNRCGIPHRFALAMQADGWYWRDEIIWHKPAPMPASLNGVRWERCRRAAGRAAGLNQTRAAASNSHDAGPADAMTYIDCPGCPKCKPHGGYVLRRGSWRTTTAHEFIFMFTKSADYFCDAEAIKEPAAAATLERNKYSRVLDDPEEQYSVAHDHEFEGSTRNPRSVWTIGPDPFKGAHYAVFPREIPERCIRAATSYKGCCPSCGAQWARVIERVDSGRTQKMADGWDTRPGAHGSIHRAGREAGEREIPVMESRTIGLRATCECVAEVEAPNLAPFAKEKTCVVMRKGAYLDPVPCTVLDIFGGSGPTAEVANGMGRRAILCELNPKYVEIAQKRIVAAMPLFAGGAVA